VKWSATRNEHARCASRLNDNSARERLNYLAHPQTSHSQVSQVHTLPLQTGHLQPSQAQPAFTCEQHERPVDDD
jgi:hypothetical protein